MGCSVFIRGVLARGGCFHVHVENSPAPSRRDLHHPSCPARETQALAFAFYFCSEIQQKKGMEEFSHGVKIFGRKGQKYHCWSIEMFPSEPLSPLGFLLTGPFLSPHSLVLSPNNFDNVDLLYQIKF